MSVLIEPREAGGFGQIRCEMLYATDAKVEKGGERERRRAYLVDLEWREHLVLSHVSEAWSEGERNVSNWNLHRSSMVVILENRIDENLGYIHQHTDTDKRNSIRLSLENRQV